MLAAGAMIGAAALGAGGSLINTGVNAYEAHLDRQFNKEEAQKQRDFEERMANTQYRRTVADMEAAGINPASLSTVSPTSGGVPASAASSSAHGVGQVDFNQFSNTISKAQDMVFAKNKDSRQELLNQVKVNAKLDSSMLSRRLDEYYKALTNKTKSENYVNFGVEPYQEL